MRFKILPTCIIANVVICISSVAQKTIIPQAHGDPSPNTRAGNGMMFTENRGQVVDQKQHQRPDILFKGSGGGADVYLRKTGVSYVLSNMGEVMHEIDEEIEEAIKEGKITKDAEQNKKQELMQSEAFRLHRIDVEFLNHNTNAETIIGDQVEGYTNYYYAHCPNGITQVNSYNEITVKNIYNNIDVKYYGGKERGLKYDIIVHPHADPSQIKLKWTGAESIDINSEGHLVIKTSVNEFTESIPRVYQNINGEIVDVKTRYILSSGEERGEVIIHFSLSTFNSSFPLVIDPWITYYGGNGVDQGMCIKTDRIGNAIVTGMTISPNFPISTGASQASLKGASDAFVVKMSPAGTRVFATFYGGSADELGTGIISDGTNNIFITGSTSSPDLPQKNPGLAYMQAFAGANDAFIAKFNSAGLLIWSTCIGGSKYEASNDISCDVNNNIVIAGRTNSSTFPTLFAYQSVLLGPAACFVSKFNNNGAMQFSTYYGGPGFSQSQANGITCDAAGSIFFTGYTSYSSFPVLMAFQPTNLAGSGGTSSFLVKLNAIGFPVWSTFFGGNNTTAGYAIAVDNSNNIIIVGTTAATTNLASPGAYQPAFGGGGVTGNDAFIAKFNNNGNRLWSTYLGGVNGDYLLDVAIDFNDNIYAYGEVEDASFGNYPISACAFQKNFGGVEDQFIAKYNPAGNQLCITYLGGSAHDELEGFAMSGGGVGGGGIAIYGNNLFATGGTDGSYPVTPGAFQTAFGGGSQSGGNGDAFIDQLCINICESKNLGLSYSANTTTVCPNNPVNFTSAITSSCDNSGQTLQWTFTGGNPVTSTLPNPTVTYPTPGIYDVKLVITTQCKKDSIVKSSYITVNNCGCTMNATISGTTNLNCTGTNNGSATVSISNGSGGTYSYNWSNGISGTTTAGTISVGGLSANSYTVTITDGSCKSISIFSISQVQSISSVATVNVACNNGSNGSALITISGGSGPYTYSMSNGVSAATNSATYQFNNLMAGTYTVTISQNACVSTTTVTLSQPAPIVVGFKEQLTCNTASVTAHPGNGSSPYSYLWNNAQTTASATGLSYSTSYTITVTDGNGCTVTAIYSAQAPQPIVIKPKAIATTCGLNNGSTNLNSVGDLDGGTPPYNIVWSTGSIGTNNNFLSAGTYTVTVTDAIGCSQTTTAIVASSTSPVSATFTQSPAGTICIGSTINFINTGTPPGTGITYNWLISPITPVNVSGTTTDFSYTFLTAGTYTITHTVNGGGCSIPVTSTVTVNNCSGSPTVTATGNSVCPGTCAVVNSSGTGGSAPYTYAWSTGATTQNINPCPGVTTTYTLTIKDSDGATGMTTAVVTVNPAVNVTVTPTNITCNGSTNGSTLAAPGGGTPGYTYNWSNGAAGSLISGLSAGNYSVTVTDSKGCTAISSAAISSPPAIAGQFTKGTASCSGCGCKEWVMVSATGGTSPYSYSWPDGYGNRYKNQLCPGAYSVNIKDKNGCSVNLNLTAP
ncbi:MAG: PKD domain-containing protein [Bacteroidetes bacterium]|nr:PKD domain-containing protein [Bacteroidota bacterium]